MLQRQDEFLKWGNLRLRTLEAREQRERAKAVRQAKRAGGGVDYGAMLDEGKMGERFVVMSAVATGREDLLKLVRKTVHETKILEMAIEVARELLFREYCSAVCEYMGDQFDSHFLSLPPEATYLILTYLGPSFYIPTRESCRALYLSTTSHHALHPTPFTSIPSSLHHTLQYIAKIDPSGKALVEGLPGTLILPIFMSILSGFGGDVRRIHMHVARLLSSAGDKCFLEGVNGLIESEETVVESKDLLEYILTDKAEIVCGVYAKYPTYVPELDELIEASKLKVYATYAEVGCTSALITLLGVQSCRKEILQEIFSIFVESRGKVQSIVAAAARVGDPEVVKAGLEAWDDIDLMYKDGEGKSILCHWADGGCDAAALSHLVPYVTTGCLLCSERDAPVMRLLADVEKGFPSTTSAAYKALHVLLSNGCLKGGYPLYWVLRKIHTSPHKTHLQDIFRHFLQTGCGDAEIHPCHLPPHLPLRPSQIAAWCTETSCMRYAEDDELGRAHCIALDDIVILREMLNPQEGGVMEGVGEEEVADDWEVLA